MNIPVTFRARRAAVRAAIEHDAEIVLYNGPIDERGFSQVPRAFPTTGSDRVILILVTNGGSIASAYRIARFFQTACTEFIVFPSSFCKSAGTIITIGASKLLLWPLSELGPIDVQMLKKDEIWERKSGLLTHSTLEALQREIFSLFEHFILEIRDKSGGLITFETSSRIAAQVAGTAFSSIFAKVDPNIPGEEFRDLMVGQEYARRLAHWGGNISEHNVKILVNSYPSHDFIIDFREASELFFNIDQPKASLYKLVSALGDLAMVELDEPAVIWLSERKAGRGTAGKGGDGRDEDVEAGAGDAAVPSEAAERSGVERGGRSGRGRHQETIRPRGEDSAGDEPDSPPATAGEGRADSVPDDLAPN